MTQPEIARQRLIYQRLAGPQCKDPGEVVRWLGAVQAQDYYAALWAIGLRMGRASEREVEAAIAERLIIRTWLMRGTLHFVAPEDIRWILKLTAPRMQMLENNTLRYQKLTLDEATLARSFDVLTEALAGGRQLTRTELAQRLEDAGINTEGMRLTFILHRAQAAELICQAVRRGKQFTFTLLDEWVPPAETPAREAALGEFARRYFTSHGPATAQDFAWWTGLSVTDARAGLARAEPYLARDEFDGQVYWRSRAPAFADGDPPTAYLLPNYDEYLVSYRDRSAAVDEPHLSDSTREGSIFNRTMVLDGEVVGLWRRTLGKDSVTVELRPFAPLDAAAAQAFAEAAQRYGEFLGLRPVLA